tara:strand:+ start:50 stop:532 length:483 start_codon:yes stop_codon:yes gene_type:complete
MIESFADANEELKRVDHLIFVSLKYTRTKDVIVNIIKRVVDCIDFLIESHLKYAQDKKKLKEDIPKNRALKAELLKEVFADSEEIVEMGDFYLWLRRILRAKHTKINEFKRHVALITDVKDDDGEMEKILIGIDELEELYHTKLKRYMIMTNELIKSNSK